MTEERIAQLEALCQQASPGPWILWNGFELDGELRAAGRIGPHLDSGFGIRAHDWPTGDLIGNKVDFELAAEARAALPEALAEVRRLRGQVDSWQQWYKDFVAQTKALPYQHEIPERGSSTYNWHMAIIRDIERMIAGEEVSP